MRLKGNIEEEFKNHNDLERWFLIGYRFNYIPAGMYPPHFYKKAK